MQLPPSAMLDLPHVIQLAVAPVFLLSGVGVTLGVLATRLGRIIDRARTLEKGPPDGQGAPQQEAAVELRVLSRRAQLINRGITLCTTAALLICILIAGLFLGVLLGLELTIPLSALFVAAMLAMVGAYVSFIREVFLATASLRFGGRRH